MKVAVGKAAVIVLVQVGDIRAVAVADGAGGGIVGVGGNKIAYEHPERRIKKRGIKRYIFIVHILTQPGNE